MRIVAAFIGCLLLVMAVVVAALSNGLRVTLICALAYYEVGSPLHGPFHVLHGLFVAGVGYAVLFAGLRVLVPKHERQPRAIASSAAVASPSPARGRFGPLPASAVLILPADLPFASVEDIELMLRPRTTDPRPLIALSSDEAGEGTNALLLAPPGDFVFHYGPGSFRAHCREAESNGRAVHIVDASGLRFDLDTESDWLVYSRQAVRG